MARRSTYFATVALAGCLLLPVAAAAVPVTFTITGGSWALGGGWGNACLSTVNCDSSHTSMNVTWSIDQGLPQTFYLNVGESFTLTFGTAVWSEEDNKISIPKGSVTSDETDDLGVTGILNISSPLHDGVNDVGVVVASDGATDDSANDLTVTFAPVTVIFAGGRFEVDFSDPAWTCNPKQACVASSGESQTITATFTLMPALATSAPVPPTNGAAVPEPATLALLGLGLAGLGFSRRRIRA